MSKLISSVGLVGTYGGGVGGWGGAIAKGVELGVPSTAAVFHSERCK